MSDFNEDPPRVPDVVNLDSCPKKKTYIVGAITGFLLTINPIFMTLCCLPVILTSFIAVYNYTKTFSITIKAIEGIKIGVVSCLLGYGFALVVQDIAWAVFDFQIGQGMYLSFMESLLEQVPPEMQDRLGETLDQARDMEFTPAIIVQQAFSLVLVSAIGGSIGGSIGAAVFKKGPVAE